MSLLSLRAAYAKHSALHRRPFALWHRLTLRFRWSPPKQRMSITKVSYCCQPWREGGTDGGREGGREGGRDEYYTVYIKQ